MWTQDEAIKLCIMIEAVCPAFGCHVALTGGTLYKAGLRKDADILFYRIRQSAEIDIEGLLHALQDKLGIEHKAAYGWVHKATYKSKGIDLFFPEYGDDEQYDGALTASLADEMAASSFEEVPL